MTILDVRHTTVYRYRRPVRLGESGDGNKLADFGGRRANDGTARRDFLAAV